MTTRSTRLAMALCVLIATILATAAASHAATGTTTINYGPYTIPAGNGDPHGHHDGMGMITNQLSTNVQRPCSGAACTLTGIKADMVYADGTTANWNTEAMLHHMVLLAGGGGRTDLMCPAGFGGVSGSQFTERIFASGNERTPVDFTGSSLGVKLGSSDQLHLVADLMNIKTSPQTVYIKIEYKWATGTDNTSRTGVRPVWLDVDGCGDSEYNAFLRPQRPDARRDSADHRCTGRRRRPPARPLAEPAGRERQSRRRRLRLAAGLRRVAGLHRHEPADRP